MTFLFASSAPLLFMWGEEYYCNIPTSHNCQGMHKCATDYRVMALPIMKITRSEAADNIFKETPDAYRVITNWLFVSPDPLFPTSYGQSAKFYQASVYP